MMNMDLTLPSMTLRILRWLPPVGLCPTWELQLTY